MSAPLTVSRRAVLSAPALLVFPAGAQGRWQPTRPVRLVVPFGPGGTSDLLARVLAERLSARLEQRVVVENRPGGGSSIGAEAVAASPADGHMLLFGGMSTNAINLTLYPRGADLVRALAPVGLLIGSANVLLINPARRDFASLEAALAAARAEPGRLNYGSNGSGSVTHLTMELLKAQAGVDIQHVPYRGSPIPGLLAGDVHMGFDGVVSATQQVRGGALKALGVTSAARVSSLPEVPTIAEAGVPGFDVPSWYAIFARPGAPEALARWREELAAVAAEPAFAELLVRTGTYPMPSSATELERFLAREQARWSEIVARSGARVD
jgi:tripartite-type tricarboxylate transporter receptor subunit TctC